MRYFDDVHANMRLAHTVVRTLDGYPIFVRRVEDKTIQAYNLINNEELELDFEDIDFKPIPLGFINGFGYRAIYLYRRPVRKYKQGLNIDNIGMSFIERRMDFSRLMEFVYQPCLNKYDSLDKIFNKDEGKLPFIYGPHKAFHRFFAINLQTNDLYYKIWKVGTINKNKEYVLEKNAEVLKELLEEVLYAN